MGKKKQKQKVVLPPELPPEVPEDEIEVSDEDLEFVNRNKEYAGFVSKLDTQSITRHVNRVADVKEDALESLYEKRLRKKSLAATENIQHEVDPVDALPVKTLDGEVYYRTVSKAPNKFQSAHDEDETVGENEDVGRDNSVVKLTKAEKRAKFKKLRKEAKKQGKEVVEEEEVEPSSQADVLAEVEKDLSAEEANEKRKFRLAELGTAMLTDPEANIKSLKEMLQICKDGDQATSILGLKSLLAVFKDIIPGTRIRLPTEKELAMVVSKEVKKTRFYESTLLTVYKVMLVPGLIDTVEEFIQAYLQKLMALEKVSSFKRVAIRCICTLLEANPRFNFRESLLGVVINNISSTDDVIRKLCCNAIKSLFTNEGKHGGELTVEAVQLIANLVKDHDCHLHPDSVEVFLSLSFDEDLRKPEVAKPNRKAKNKKYKIGNRNEDKNQLLANDKKKSKQEMISKTREEVKAEFMAASFAQDAMEKRRIQSDTLSSVFQTYFRILKHAMRPGSEANGFPASPFGEHPLLAPCLNGIGKFSHLIDLDFMADLMNYLRRLAGGSIDANRPSENFSSRLTVSERLRCCIVAFKVMRNNLDALNVDLQDFFIQLYNLILEYRPGRQHDMQRAAAFIKRLASFSLCFGAAESMAGSIAKYQPYASDPSLSGAFATVLWELTLLSKHYHPSVSTMASGISTITNAHDQVYRSNVSPQQAFIDMSLDNETFAPKTNQKQSNNKRKKGNRLPPLAAAGGGDMVDELAVRTKLSEHFLLVHDVEENRRLRRELERTKLGLQLYKEYKKQKKQRTR
ncbi:Armadillo-like helical [Cynara cardunculus var. scolymus]|uniref:Armadillo-like helical n=1 Tax=Cynara cardunculus var. scolymus TaxID=59895 RepID=A0A103YJI0_CYNCS|nr:Armadillo-like helical [Cynara cardunculus var. scolymus]